VIELAQNHIIKVMPACYYVQLVSITILSTLQAKVVIYATKHVYSVVAKQQINAQSVH
jgi:hypothetical protein